MVENEEVEKNEKISEFLTLNNDTKGKNSNQNQKLVGKIQQNNISRKSNKIIPTIDIDFESDIKNDQNISEYVKKKIIERNF